MNEPWDQRGPRLMQPRFDRPDRDTEFSGHLTVAQALQVEQPHGVLLAVTRGGGPFIAAWFKDPAGNLLEVLQER